ncbi:MAG: transglycosylase domain-containing protein, partial [Mycobacteriales bacterium]
MSSPFDRPSRGSASVPGGTPGGGTPYGRPRPTPASAKARPARRLPPREASSARDDFDRDPRRVPRRRPWDEPLEGSDRTSRAGTSRTGGRPPRHPEGTRKPGTKPDPKTAGLAPEEIKKRKKKRRRQILLISTLVLLVLIVAGMGVSYAALQVPLPDLAASKQTSVIYYSDGKTELARIGVQNRQEVKLKDIPKTVQHAVISAEDRSFYQNSGIS